MDAGADVLEIDVRATCDNVLVLMHDATVDRTTDGGGCVEDYRFDNSSVGTVRGGSCKDSARRISDLDAGYGWPYCCKPHALREEAKCRLPRRSFERDVDDCCTTHPFRAMQPKVLVPTLKEVLDKFAGWTNTRMIIEIKGGAETARSFCNLVAPYGDAVMDRLLVASFHQTALKTVRSDPRCCRMAVSASPCELVGLSGEITTDKRLKLLQGLLKLSGAVLAETARCGSPAKEAVRYLTGREAPPSGWRINAIQVPAKLITEDRGFVSKVREKYKQPDLKVHAWTVNDPAEMWEMMDAGVDGIITDYPSHLFERRKQWRATRTRC